ncbi:hypothetical protein OUZ56_012921 [Daphnia magna]|uniref:Uncharacterized protein n=1 Tax=Daphnia magna TaxID=35525 RepID=A0ABQ9Z4F8_9CRUS|nr:hypothetical protein OUZ56_012921 [Daphnia magna]
MPTKKNPRLPSCLRDPNRRLHPLRELSSVPVETSPTPASSLESGTSFVGEALNFEGPIPKDHLTKEAYSQGESVETSRGLYSDPETEIDLRAATSPVVPVGGQQFVVPSRHIEQPQRQAMEAVRKFIRPPIFRKKSEEDAHQLMERFEEYSTHNRWEMSHPLLGQSCDRGEEIIGRSPLQERYADMQSGRGVIRATDCVFLQSASMISFGQLQKAKQSFHDRVAVRERKQVGDYHRQIGKSASD